MRDSQAIQWHHWKTQPQASLAKIRFASCGHHVCIALKTHHSSKPTFQYPIDGGYYTGWPMPKLNLCVFFLHVVTWFHVEWVYFLRFVGFCGKWVQKTLYPHAAVPSCQIFQSHEFSRSRATLLPCHPWGTPLLVGAGDFADSMRVINCNYIHDYTW